MLGTICGMITSLLKRFAVASRQPYLVKYYCQRLKRTRGLIKLYSKGFYYCVGLRPRCYSFRQK